LSVRPPSRRSDAKDAEAEIRLAFDDNRLLPLLFGEHERFLAKIAHHLAVRLTTRGNALTISGPADAADAARRALEGLHERIRQGLDVGIGEVDAAIRMAMVPAIDDADPMTRLAAPGTALRTKRRTITPRSPTQGLYLDALARHELVFGLGPAGTGKTYLAVAKAVTLLMEGMVERIILSRPAVEAGERLGFLPGDMKDKVDPYLRPLYDALYDMLPSDQVAKRLDNGIIEVAPLAFMRGRTLADAFVILDEAQNTTPMQMKMFLTRMGEGSRMVVTGDLTQVDLPAGQRSGLAEALSILEGTAGIGIVRFKDDEVVRHPLVGRIVRAYAERDRSIAAGTAS
jgi:phosphate starvation-inducible protein PhoH and related proteins